MHCTYVTRHPLGFYYYGKGQLHMIERLYYKGSGTKLKEYFKTYPKSEWTVEILQTFENNVDAYNAERLLVTFDMLQDPNCLNLQSGGGTRSHCSEETKEKMRAASIGRKQSPETIAKRTAGRKKWLETHDVHNKGKQTSAEVKAKMREAKLGKKHSPETCEKIRQLKLGTKRIDGKMVPSPEVSQQA